MIQFCFGSIRNLFLLGGGIKDGAPVLRANIRPLPVAGGGVVVVPKDGEQLIVGDLLRIVSDPHRFRMAGLIGANVAVGRVFGVPAGVAHFREEHAFGLAQCLFDSPETAGSEDRSLGGCEFQRSGIEAITEARRLGAVRKHMSQMGVTPGAKNFIAL